MHCYAIILHRGVIMYYGMVSAAVIMFGLQFFFNQKYESGMGNGRKASMWFILLSNAVGLFILLIVNGFKMEFTPFTFIVAFVAAVTVAVAIDTAFVAAPYSFDVVVAEHSSAAVIADSACSFVAVVAGSGNLQ